MGAGKTIISLSTFVSLYNSSKINNALIIAPLRVANSTWHSELKNWAHTQHLTYSIATGNVNNRQKAINNNANLTITNCENTEWIIKENKKFDMLIIDESSKFKNPSAKRFKILKNYLDNFKYIILLTGTPCPNSYIDIWSQIYLIDKGQRLGYNISQFKAKYFIRDYMGFNYELKKNAEIEINNKIKDITMTIDNPVELPDINYKNEYIELDKDIEKKYKELEKEFLLTIRDREIPAINKAVLQNKLLQFCNGSIYDEDKNIVNIHDYKIKLLKEILEEINNCIIVYNYQSDLQNIKNNIKDCKTIKSDEDIKAWNDGKIKRLLLHPASASHGLNLQYGGNIIIWYGINYNLEQYLQMNKRLHRSGQVNNVNIIHLLIKNKLDDIVLNYIIKNKNITQKAFLDYFIDNH